VSTPGRIVSDAHAVPDAAASAPPGRTASPREARPTTRRAPACRTRLRRGRAAVRALKSSLVGLERSEKLQRALFAIADLAGSDASMPELLRGVHAIVDSLMYAKNCFIVRLDAERDAIVFLYFVDTVDPPHLGDVSLSKRKGTLTWYVLTDGKSIRGDNEQLQAQVSGPLSFVGSDSYVWMGAPMLRDGVVQGAIVVQCYEPGMVYTEEDQAVLEFVASHVLTAMERKQGRALLEANVRQRTTELALANKELHQEIGERQRAERLQAALFHIAQLATADISQDELYARVHTAVGELINARNFFIALLSDDGKTLEFPYAVDASGERFSSRPGRPRPVRVRAAPRPAHLPLRGDAGAGARGRAGPAHGRHAGGVVAGRAAGGRGQDDRPGGGTKLRRLGSYSHADQELLGFAASQIANTLHRRRAALELQQANEQLELRVQERTRELRAEISERQRIQEQLRHQVMHDSLTGLPNRGYLIDRLGRVLAHLRREPSRRCALLYLDVDRFKQINDSMGHQAGDEVLREVARRLQGCVREPDVVARLSGDEFAVLLEDVEIPGTAGEGGAAHPVRARRAAARAPPRRGDIRQRRHRRGRCALRARRRDPARRRRRPVPAPRRSGAAASNCSTNPCRSARSTRSRSRRNCAWRWPRTSSSPGSSRSCACPTTRSVGPRGAAALEPSRSAA
jgi:GGDEF domain-containing protein